jgi:hypothetical protein
MMKKIKGRWYHTCHQAKSAVTGRWVTAAMQKGILALPCG